MPALQGVAVLVTRPAHQAERLCDLLQRAGAGVVRLPLLAIKPARDAHTGLEIGTPAAAFDLIIFTSANAVTFGAPLLATATSTPVAAIGAATARAAEQAGFRVSALPTASVDSEGLLSHAALNGIAGKRVLIVTGSQGRDLLRQRLTARGARVTVATVYVRERIRHEPQQVAALMAAHAIDVITATSVEIAAALLELAAAGLHREFARVHWLVPSLRVAAALREQGVTAPILQAQSAEDQELVAALLRWRSSGSHG